MYIYEYTDKLFQKNKNNISSFDEDTEHMIILCTEVKIQQKQNPT